MRTMMERMPRASVATVAMALGMLAACGGGGGGDTPPQRPAPVLSLVAGSAEGPGSIDGTGGAARFSRPTGIAADGVGNFYVIDTGNYTVRKITAAGAVTTLAGTPDMGGSDDGTGAAARFLELEGIAADRAGNVYVTESSDCVVRKITAAGVVTRMAGTPYACGSADGIGAAAQFKRPAGLAVDAGSTLYVADQDNNTIRKISPAGVVTTYAGTAGVTGASDGPVATATFRGPHGLAFDDAGTLYVADTRNHVIRKITADGIVSTLAGAASQPGNVDGTGAAARFTYPYGIAVDAAANILVADTFNQTIRKITPQGAVSTPTGNRFAYPSGLVADGNGNVLVADQGNDVLKRVAPDGTVTIFAGSMPMPGSTDGTGAAARFYLPTGTATDSRGNVYVADASNAIIRKMTPAGVVTTFAGEALQYGSNDGIGTAARFVYPRGLALDRADNLYVADVYGPTIRKITPDGTVSTFAGVAGRPGDVDGPRDVARFVQPTSIAADSGGNFYVTDGASHTVRKITPAGVVSTLAGTAGEPGTRDGNGAGARFAQPMAIAVDRAGNVFVGDTNVVRKITPDADVTTYAGSPGVMTGDDGIGAAASITNVYGLALDDAGNVYFADVNLQTLRKITPDRKVTTIVGRRFKGGFEPGSLPGLIARPMGLAYYNGTLYFATVNGIARVTDVP